MNLISKIESTIDTILFEPILPTHAKSDFPKMRFKAQIRGKSIDVPSLMHIITLGKEHPPCVYMTQKY